MGLAPCSILLLTTLVASCCGHAELPSLSAPPTTDYLAQEFDFEASRPPVNLPAWAASHAQLELMVAEALSWAACNGILMRASAAGDDEDSAPTFTHAPFSLLPCEFPAAALAEAYALAPVFGKLVESVSRDVPWLSRTLTEVAESDDFIRNLLKLCVRVQREGPTQDARLAILRSDYMLHEPDGVEEGQLLQVELNTIASSFAGLSQRVAAMHSALMPRWASTRRHAWQAAGKPSQLSMTSVLPPNAAADNLAEALAQAHGLYAQDHASILFVVQPHERNHVDQDLLREKLWSMYGVRVICRTLAQVRPPVGGDAGFRARGYGRRRVGRHWECEQGHVWHLR